MNAIGGLPREKRIGLWIALCDGNVRNIQNSRENNEGDKQRPALPMASWQRKHAFPAKEARLPCNSKSEQLGPGTDHLERASSGHPFTLRTD
jgi:hypothetical protein